MRQYVALESVAHARKSGKEGAKSLSKFTLVIGNTVQVLAVKDPSVRRKIIIIIYLARYMF